MHINGKPKSITLLNPDGKFALNCQKLDDGDSVVFWSGGDQGKLEEFFRSPAPLYQWFQLQVRDQFGQPVTDPYGRPVLKPWEISPVPIRQTFKIDNLMINDIKWILATTNDTSRFPDTGLNREQISRITYNLIGPPDSSMKGRELRPQSSSERLSDDHRKTKGHGQ